MTKRTTAGARRLSLSAAAFLLLNLLPAPSRAQGQYPTNITYAAPITITQGGTYTGNFRSTDSNTPCIRIQTTQPVTITGCVLVGAGDLIDAKNGGSTLVITNNKGYGIQQSLDNRRHGRFLEVNSGRSVRVENNYFEHTSGIAAYQWSGDGSAAQTLTVRYNQAKNIDGRFRNGGGEYVQFCGLNQVRNVGSMEIGWNQVINEPNNSLVEDNINFYNSGGTQQSPARVHDNYVQGAYPYPANGSKFTGTGMTTDGDGSSATTTAAFIEAYNNQFISTCNAAMNIAAGHDIHYHDNRMITSALLPDGSALNATYAATAIFNAYQQPSNVFYGNATTNNTIGFVKQGYNVPFPNRHDLSSGACSNCTGTNHLPNPITLQTEQGERDLWQQKLQQNNVKIGADGTNTGTTPAPAPAPAPTPAPAPAPADPTNAIFARAINLNGPAATIDGKSWEAGSSATGFQINGSAFANQGVTLTPATDAARAAMIRSSVYSTALTANVAVSNGTYLVYAYVWEDNNATTYSLALEGQTVQSNYNSGAAGSWSRLGPYTADVTDGNLTLTTSGGDANLSGIEIWKANTAANQAPTVSLAAASASVTVNTALALTATAADADGTVAKVEFFSGATKLGEDTSAPYSFSFTPSATGTLSLTARATDNAGATTTSAAISVTVTAPPVVSTPPTTFPGPTGATFLRGINLNGAALSLDGNQWEAASGAANLTVTGTNFSNPASTPEPAVDATRAAMLTSAVGGQTVGATISGLSTGTYSVYAYIWEDNGPETTDIVINGSTVRAGYNTGAAGHWERLGPFKVDVTGGSIALTTSGGHPNLSGVEVWQHAAPVATTTFFRAINLNGAALTLDGNAWQASTAGGYSTNGQSFANQGVSLTPSTTTARAQMIRSSVYGRKLTFTMNNVPNGDYEVYAYIWEDNKAQTVSLSLNGQPVLTNYNTGSAGSWKKVGPYAVTVTNGSITLAGSGGDLNLSGVEVWSKKSGTAFQLNPFRPAAATLATLAPAATPPAAAPRTGLSVPLAVPTRSRFTGRLL